jgi:hypothetical protein
MERQTRVSTDTALKAVAPCALVRPTVLTHVLPVAFVAPAVPSFLSVSCADADPDDDDDALDDEDDDAAGAEDGALNDVAGTTAENSASSTTRFRTASPSVGGGGGGVAIELTHGVLAQGPNVSTRSYNNAPIDLDAVLATQTGGVISTPAFPNHHHPPVTIHF